EEIEERNHSKEEIGHNNNNNTPAPCRQWYPPSQLLNANPHVKIELLEVNKQTSNIEGLKFELEDILHHNEDKSDYFLAYDVYQPASFQKKNKKRVYPSWRLVICRAIDPIPSLLQMERLFQQSNPIPVKFCLVDSGIISFF